MNRVVIFGNSGSGKSTLAKRLCREQGLAHLDLDTIAWQDTQPPVRTPLEQAKAVIDAFVERESDWVIEGCYADLLTLASRHASEMVFLDLPVSACIENAHARPWEPHKYSSKAEQDANLDMLLDWIRDYPSRQDECSRPAHQRLFDSFDGTKRLVNNKP